MFCNIKWVFLKSLLTFDTSFKCLFLYTIKAVGAFNDGKVLVTSLFFRFGLSTSNLLLMTLNIIIMEYNL